MLWPFKHLVFLFDPSARDFAEWEAELTTTDLRLTSSAWVGWYEE